MNPIFAQYNSLSAALQALHENNVRIVESVFLEKIRRILQPFLEKVEAFKERLFRNEVFQEENMNLKEELEVLRMELKEKDAILSILEKEYISAQEKTKNFQIAVHEIKTPLTSIIGFSELLLKNKDAFDESRVELLERIYLAGKKQLDIINQMLSNVKPEVEWEEVNLLVMIDEIRANIAVIAKKKGLALDVSIEPRVPKTIRTDAMKLNSILTNLLSNAVKYTDQGTIRFKISAPQSNKLLFQVQDTGRGIAPHEQEEIFSFFHRGSNVEEESGLGVGLALCQEMTQMLDGELSVYSEGTGKGSIFTLNLPLSAKLGVAA